jgi:hypothetical protein
MGCDIHVAIEMRYGHMPDRWFLHSTPHIWRDYHLFAKLANVRNYEDYSITPIAEPRGFPPNISKDAREYLECHGDHSASWISEEEFKVFFPYPSTFESASDWTLSGWSAIKNNSYYGDKVRWVFNFDN